MKWIVYFAAVAATTIAAAAPPDRALSVEAVEALKKTLMDPYSAKIEGLQAGDLPKKIVCGWVNAKNSYGAYTGRKKWYYFKVSGPGLIVMEGEPGLDQTFPTSCPGLK